MIELEDPLASKQNNVRNEIDALLNEAKELEYVNPNRTMDMALEALEKSRRAGYILGSCMAMLRIGRAHISMGEVDKAIRYLIEALELSQKTGHEKIESEIFNALGNVFLEFSNFDKALENYMLALKIAIASGHKELETRIYNNIGIIYLELQEYISSEEYFKKSVHLCKEYGYEQVSIAPIINIGEIRYALKEYDTGIEYFEEALKLSEKYHDNVSAAQIYNSLGKCYGKLSSKEKAYSHMHKGIGICEKYGFNTTLIFCLMDLGEIEIENNAFENALDHINHALEMAMNLKLWALSAKLSMILAKFFENHGDFENALINYKKYYEMNTLHENEKADQKIKNVTTQFKMEQAQNEKELFRIKNIELKEKTDLLELRTGELEAANNVLNVISKIGQDITGSLDARQVYDKVYHHVNELMDAYFFGIAIYDDEEKNIRFGIFIENNVVMDELARIDVDSAESFTAICFRTRQPIFLTDIQKEYRVFVNKRTQRDTNNVTMHSAIFYPLIFEGQPIGVISIQSPKKEAYKKREFDMIMMLASYVSIAINNAIKSEKLENEIFKRKRAQEELEELSQRLLNLSQIDGLTGVSNRRRFDEYIEMEWKRALREKLFISVMFIDVDFFKQYNDNYGHLSGDYCLIKVANALKGTIKRGTDLIARFGGDEFVVVLCNTDFEGAKRVAASMISEVNKMEIVHEFSKAAPYVSITIGIACTVPSFGDNYDTLINHADKSLYHAKQNGRNHFEIIQL